MAWGDIRYDHSDIFNPPPGERTRRERELVKAQLDRTIKPGHPQWEKALRICREGSTVDRLGAALQHKNPRASTARLVTRMLKAGVLERRRVSTGSKGQKPYVYYTVNDKRREEQGNG